MRAEVLLPRPAVDNETEPYWSACQSQELLVQVCEICGGCRFPPRPLCPKCGSLRRAWRRACGKGVLYSWVVVHHAVHPGATSRVPYILGLVEMEEGPRMVTGIVGPPERLVAGCSVVVAWEQAEDGFWLPVFGPVDRARR